MWFCRALGVLVGSHRHVQLQQRTCPSFMGLNPHRGVSLAPWRLHARPGLRGFHQSFLSRFSLLLLCPHSFQRDFASHPSVFETPAPFRSCQRLPLCLVPSPALLGGFLLKGVKQKIAQYFSNFHKRGASPCSRRGGRRVTRCSAPIPPLCLPPGAGELSPADVSLALWRRPPTAGVVPCCDRGKKIGHLSCATDTATPGAFVCKKGEWSDEYPRQSGGRAAAGVPAPRRVRGCPRAPCKRSEEGGGCWRVDAAANVGGGGRWVSAGGWSWGAGSLCLAKQLLSQVGGFGGYRHEKAAWKVWNISYGHRRVNNPT